MQKCSKRSEEIGVVHPRQEYVVPHLPFYIVFMVVFESPQMVPSGENGVYLA